MKKENDTKDEETKKEDDTKDKETKKREVDTKEKEDATGTAEVSNTGDNFFLLFIQIYSPFASFLLSWLACLLPHKQAIAIDTKEETKKKWIRRRRKMLGGTAKVSNTGETKFLLFVQIYSSFDSFILSCKQKGMKMKG